MAEPERGDQGTALAALNVSQNDNQNGNVRNTKAVECRVSPASCHEWNGLLRVSHG